MGLWGNLHITQFLLKINLKKKKCWGNRCATKELESWPWSKVSFVLPITKELPEKSTSTQLLRGILIFTFISGPLTLVTMKVTVLCVGWATPAVLSSTVKAVYTWMGACLRSLGSVLQPWLFSAFCQLLELDPPCLCCCSASQQIMKSGNWHFLHKIQFHQIMSLWNPGVCLCHFLSSMADRKRKTVIKRWANWACYVSPYSWLGWRKPFCLEADTL